MYCLLILASVRPEVTHMRRLVPSLHSQAQGFDTPGRNHLTLQVSVTRLRYIGFIWIIMVFPAILVRGVDVRLAVEE